MKEKSRSGAFPPPLGWIPIGVALLLVTIASVAAFVPQYGTHRITGLTSADNGQEGGPGPGEVPGGNQPGGGGGGGGGGSGNGPGSVNGPGSGPGSHGTGTTSDCAHHNAGATDVGVTATRIHIATTDVTTGIGAGFLGEAVSGMRAAIDQANNTGGICGRQIVLDSINDQWDRVSGSNDISNYINSGNVFALVGEPDSEGLDAASASGSIDRAGIPVVGTDGMLKSQYNDPWIWPVAASTVTNMHIIAQYAVKKLHAQHVGIVYDNVYKFGKEGASAFAAEIQRLAGSPLGLDPSKGCAGGYCGVDPSSDDYSGPVHDFNTACGGNQGSPQCRLVVMLLEPGPMGNWMKAEENYSGSWYGTLMGGEPLFDDSFGDTCGQDCAGMVVWSGYKPDLQPFDAEAPVYTYASLLHGACNTCDPHNEFTEGAYLGTKLFIAACQKVGSTLTRAALRQELDSDTFDLGLSTPLRYGNSLPHQANISMAAYQDNASGTFNGWSYMQTGFIADPDPHQDLQG